MDILQFHRQTSTHSLLRQPITSLLKWLKQTDHPSELNEIFASIGFIPKPFRFTSIVANPAPTISPAIILPGNVMPQISHTPAPPGARRVPRNGDPASWMDVANGEEAWVPAQLLIFSFCRRCRTTTYLCSRRWNVVASTVIRITDTRPRRHQPMNTWNTRRPVVRIIELPSERCYTCIHERITSS